MAATEPSPIATQAQQASVDHYLLKELGKGVENLRTEVRGYRDEAVQSNAKLDEHIRACDRRYHEMRSSDATHEATTKRIGKRVLERSLDYVIFALIALAIYALKHGAPLPTPT